MKNNGYGSIKQTITISTKYPLTTEFLDHKKLKILERGEKFLLAVVERWTTKPEDDETLVFELSNRIGHLSFDIKAVHTYS